MQMSLQTAQVEDSATSAQDPAYKLTAYIYIMNMNQYEERGMLINARMSRSRGCAFGLGEATERWLTA